MLIRDARIEFRDAEAFLEEYEGKLSAGWMFIPSEDEFALGEILEVTIDLAFCGHTARALSIVKSRISPALAKILDRPAGAVVEFADGIQALEEMLEDTIERLLAASCGRADASDAPRRHRRFEVSLPGTCAPAPPAGERGTANARAQTRTKNLSTSGALLEVDGLDLTCGQTISLTLLDPATSELVALTARVVRSGTSEEARGALAPEPARAAEASPVREPTPPTQPSPLGDEAADSPTTPRLVGVEFVDTPASGARKTAFLSRIREITHGQTIGGISGNLAGLSLPSLLQSIATSSECGTMEIIGEATEAHLFFASNEFRDAKMGRIHGVKVLARLIEWSEGEFYFHPRIEGGAPPEPGIPIERAVMEAVYQAEELRRIAGDLLPETVLLERTERGDPDGLSDLERAVLALLDRPACPGTIVDALPDADFEIWGALTSLRTRDLIRLREE